MEEKEFKENELTLDELEEVPGGIRDYRRCKICGRPYSVDRKYGICNTCIREMMYKKKFGGDNEESL